MERWEGSQLNKAKEILAFELTKLVHGEEEAVKAQDSARALFSKGNAADMPTAELTQEDLREEAADILTVLQKSGLVKSRSEGRRAVEQGGVNVDGEKVTDVTTVYTADVLKNGIVVKKGKKNDAVQDAYEGIRPTSILRTPESVKAYLSNDEYKLYKMIYYRALASLMKDAETTNTTVVLDNNNYQFKATGQVIVFDGYLKVYSDYEDTKENILPPFDTYNSNVIVANDITKEQHFTKPPARYTEAKLIEEMEKLGIGRPSTYATTMETLKLRKYADQNCLAPMFSIDGYVQLYERPDCCV